MENLQQNDANKVSKVTAVYFSPTNTTKKIVTTIANTVAVSLQCGMKEFSLTLPDSRDYEMAFTKEDFIVLGVPVYGGRIPVVLESTLQKLKGNNTAVILVAVYGNRDYDDALVEMEDFAAANGFFVVGAGAFIGEHSLTSKVGEGRPDEADIKSADVFALKCVEKWKQNKKEKLHIKGNRPYKDRMPSAPVKPKTSDTCTKCMICAKNCPMGIISMENPKKVGDNCLRCCACVKSCPVKAKYFDDDMYFNFKAMLESNCMTRKEPEFFYK